jgi:hypothetical protein
MQEVTAETAEAVAKATKAGVLPGPAKTLAEALARIYADGGRYVQKTGQMQGVARYSYAKEGDFIAAIRPLMETHGVTVRPVGQHVVTNEAFERKGGGTAYRVVILATFEFLHTSGDAKQAQAFGEGIDSGDKAFNKAMTGAMKYALRQTFCVETGDDPDDQPSGEQERKPAAKEQADNLELRGKAETALRSCKDRAAYLMVCKQLNEDVSAGKFSKADRDHLSAVSREINAKYPQAKQTA